jgi:hypothetical protein
MRTGLASTLVLCGAAACGGGNLDPGAGNDAGSGTGTLAIDGSAHASPQQVNARLRTDFDTALGVRVSRNNQTVTSGTVTITSSSGKTALTYHNDRWSGTAPGYDQVYILDVVSGADRVEGVRVDGPDIHVFSQPTEGATVDPTIPLPLVWSRENAADTATLHADNIDAITIPDSGTYSLAPGSLRTDKSQPRPNTLRLTRTNRVVPRGAAAGSTWAVTIDNAIDVVAEPQGLPL